MKHILLHDNPSGNAIVIAIDEIAIVKSSSLGGAEVYIKSLEKNELIRENPGEIYRILKEANER